MSERDKMVEALRNAADVLEEAATYTASESWSPSMTEEVQRAERIARAALASAKSAPPETVEPVAVVKPHGATVLLDWASVSAAHNAKPGYLYASPPSAAQAVLTNEQAQELKRLADEMVGAMAREPIEACRGGFSAARTALHTFIDTLGGK